MNFTHALYQGFDGLITWVPLREKSAVEYMVQDSSNTLIVVDPNGTEFSVINIDNGRMVLRERKEG